MGKLEKISGFQTTLAVFSIKAQGLKQNLETALNWTSPFPCGDPRALAWASGVWHMEGNLKIMRLGHFIVCPGSPILFIMNMGEYLTYGDAEKISFLLWN